MELRRLVAKHGLASESLSAGRGVGDAEKVAVRVLVTCWSGDGQKHGVLKEQLGE